MAVKGGLLVAEVCSDPDPKKLKDIIEKCVAFREDRGFALISDKIGDPDYLIINTGATVNNGGFVEGQPMKGIPPISGSVILVFQRK